MKKKSIAGSLILIILLSIIFQFAYYRPSFAINENVRFSVDTVQTKVGDNQVAVTVRMNDDAKFVSLDLELGFDKTKLRPSTVTEEGNVKLKYDEGTVINSNFTFLAHYVEASSKIMLGGYINSVSATTRSAGTIVTFYFDIISGAGTDANLDLECTDFKADNLGTDIDTTITDGKVQIINIAMNNTSLTMHRGITDTLSVTSTPTGTIIGETIVWNSSNPSKVTVDQSGNLEAVAIGSSTISASVYGMTVQCVVTVDAPLNSISLNKDTTKIVKSNKETLTVTYNPDDTTDSKTINWSSNNTAVATVTSNGEVTAVEAGTAIITANCGGKTDTCEVTVEIPLQSISLNKTTTTINKGQKETLTITYNPTDTTDSKDIIWSSSNTAVATVINGEVTAVAPASGGNAGTAIIRATSAINNTIYSECEVSVLVPLISISLDKAAITVPVYQVKQFAVAYNPTDTTDTKAVTWISTDPTVATVDLNGKIKALKAGTTIIKATSDKSNTIVAQCEVTVSGLLGDMNGDSKIKSYDAYMILMESKEATPVEEKIYKSDIDLNGKITSFDARLALERSIGIVSTLYWK